LGEVSASWEAEQAPHPSPPDEVEREEHDFAGQHGLAGDRDSFDEEEQWEAAVLGSAMPHPPVSLPRDLYLRQAQLSGAERSKLRLSLVFPWVVSNRPSPALPTRAQRDSMHKGAKEPGVDGAEGRLGGAEQGEITEL